MIKSLRFEELNSVYGGDCDCYCGEETHLIRINGGTYNQGQEFCVLFCSKRKMIGVCTPILEEIVIVKPNREEEIIPFNFN